MEKLVFGANAQRGRTLEQWLIYVLGESFKTLGISRAELDSMGLRTEVISRAHAGIIVYSQGVYQMIRSVLRDGDPRHKFEIRSRLIKAFMLACDRYLDER